MKKNTTNQELTMPFLVRHQKILTIMKLNVMFLVIFCLNLSAKTYSQEITVSLNLDQVSVKDFLKNVQEQTGINFLYNANLIDQSKKLTLHVKNKDLRSVLHDVLYPMNLTFLYQGESIIIKRIEEDKTIKPKYVTGTVHDEKKQPLPGVTVMWKGMTIGTVTDAQGKYKIIVADTSINATLIFSFIGMERREIKYRGRDTIHVVMKEDIEQMEEVVVTGYQTIDKRRLTSSIYSLTDEDLNFQGAVRLDQMLEGKVPGLLVMSSSATPGAAAKMRLRGSSTFTGTREPLWVIDGIIYEDPVPLSADEINSWDNINLIGNAITGLNPQDIERIDVLKDASATAIYGTRAANGVIVVTTKVGKMGKTALSYNFNAAVTQRPTYRDFDLMNSKERIDVSREIMEKGLYFSYTPERIGYEGLMMDYWEKKISFEELQAGISKMESANTDWFGALYRNSFSHTHNLSFSGGNQGTRYYFSLGYTSNLGSEIGTGLWRFTARMNLSTRLRENILFDARLSTSVQNADYNPSAYSAFDEAYYTSRTIPLRNEDGSLYYVQQPVNVNQTTQENVYAGYNILNEFANGGKNIINKSLNLTGSINWEIIPNIRYMGTFGLTSTTNLTEEWMGETSFYVAQLRGWEYGEKPGGDIPELYIKDGGTYQNSSMNQYNWTIRNQLNFNFSLHNTHHFNIDLGQEANSTIYKGTESGTFPGYMIDEGKSFSYFPVVVRGDDDYEWYTALKRWFLQGGGVFPTITDQVDNTLSFYGTFTYTYLNRYSLNFNIRNDGSNRFGQYNNEKFNPVWSVSGRWNINEEYFMSSGWAETLALRASYGYRGNVPNASPYMIITNPYTSSTSGEKYSSISSFPNANLKWEKTSTLNVGLDWAFLKGRISGALEYYYSKSVDLLTEYPISMVNGISSLLVNEGTAINQGVDFNISTTNINLKNFKWRTSLTFSYTKNEVTRGDNSEFASAQTYLNYVNGSVIRDGESVDGFYSYQFAGLDEYGLPRFKNLTGNDPNMTDIQFLDHIFTYSGTRTPQFYGSLSMEFALGKNLSLRTEFSYKLGYKTRMLRLYDDGENALPFPEENMPAIFTERWRQPGDEAYTNIPALTNVNLDIPDMGIMQHEAYTYTQVDAEFYNIAGPMSMCGWYMYDYSDLRVVKADNIRFRTITLGYSFENDWLKKIGVKNARLDFQVQNIGIITFDKDLRGQDPDQIESVGMPVLPTYNLSLNLNF